MLWLIDFNPDLQVDHRNNFWFSGHLVCLFVCQPVCKYFCCPFVIPGLFNIMKFWSYLLWKCGLKGRYCIAFSYWATHPLGHSGPSCEHLYDEINLTECEKLEVTWSKPLGYHLDLWCGGPINFISPSCTLSHLQLIAADISLIGSALPLWY